MSSDFGLVYHLWSFAGKPGELLDRAIGEVGFDHLTIPVITGPLHQFRPNPDLPPHAFHTEGGWHYPPESARYRSVSVRPRPARWFGKRDVLARVCEVAAKRNVSVILRVDLRAVTGLLEHDPHLRSRNAWGDENMAVGPCVINPDLRELLRCAIDDLLRYEPAGVELVDWTPDEGLERGRSDTRGLRGHCRTLTEICFCPACRQSAATGGLDPEQVARSVRVHFEQLISSSDDEQYGERLRNDEPLRQYLLARRRNSRRWVARLAEANGRLRWYTLHEHWGRDEHWLGSINELPAPDSDALIPLVRCAHLPPEGSSSYGLLQPTSDGQREVSALALPVWRPFVDHPTELVRGVSQATKSGATFIDFEGLEEAPAMVVDWLRQAVRYARRAQ
jgi:hypothetical protein